MSEFEYNKWVKVRVLMGGSGSTGSSLLKNILSRNPSILAGEETSLFGKRALYQNWNLHKYRLMFKGPMALANHSWHMYRAVDLYSDSYAPSRMEVCKYIIQSNTFNQFADRLYELEMHRSGANIYLEKTPSNAYCFRYFLQQFEGAKVIHTLRNPLDTIASLVGRGFSVYYATALYLCNTAAGLSSRNSDHYCEVKYEDLLSNGAHEVEKICAFIGVEFNVKMLASGGVFVSKSKLPGWTFDETDQISQSEESRFQRLAFKLQEDIITAINSLQISDIGRVYYDVKCTTIKEVCNQLSYHYPEAQPRPDQIDLLRKEMAKDMKNRRFKMYASGWQYPIEIKDMSS